MSSSMFALAEGKYLFCCDIHGELLENSPASADCCVSVWFTNFCAKMFARNFIEGKFAVASSVLRVCTMRFPGMFVIDRNEGGSVLRLTSKPLLILHSNCSLDEFVLHLKAVGRSGPIVLDAQEEDACRSEAVFEDSSDGDAAYGWTETPAQACFSLAKSKAFSEIASIDETESCDTECSKGKRRCRCNTPAALMMFCRSFERCEFRRSAEGIGAAEGLLSVQEREDGTKLLLALDLPLLQLSLPSSLEELQALLATTSTSTGEPQRLG